MDETTGARPPERSLAHYVNLLRRHWLVVALPTVVAVAVAYGLSSRTEEIYVSAATVRVVDTGSSLTGGRSATEIDQELATSVELLRSRPVRERVLEQVPDEIADAFRSFDAQRVEETVLIEFEVRATDPRAAQQLAEAWGDTYVEQERSQGGGGLMERARELTREIEALQERVEELDRSIIQLTPSAGATGSPSPQLASALNERQSLLEQQAEYRRRAIEFEIEASLREGAVSVVVPANEPSAPVSPKPMRTAGAAAVLGLLLGAGLAVLRDELDDRIRGREQLRALLPDVPLLAAIPGRRPIAPLHRGRLRMRIDGPAIEAYRALATNLELVRGFAPATDGSGDGRARVVVVTSPREGDGKTTTVAHLANALAAVGRRVVLVDADLRKGDLHEPFGARKRPGVTELVVDGASPNEALQVIWTQRHPDLAFLASGRDLHDPVHLLASPAFADLVEQLTELGDYVLVDAPPLLPVTDTLVLSRLADGVVFVVGDGHSRRADVRAAGEALSQIGASVIGAVLTSAQAGEASYGYRRGPEPLPNLPRKRPERVAPEMPREPVDSNGAGRGDGPRPRTVVDVEAHQRDRAGRDRAPARARGSKRRAATGDRDREDDASGW